MIAGGTYGHKFIGIAQSAVVSGDKVKIELHISNIYKREEFRQKSLISDVATGGIFGLGSNGYILAIMAVHKILNNENK